MFNAETLKRLRSEMLKQLLSRTLLRKHPVVELESTPAIAEMLLKLRLHLPVVQHLLRLERCKQLLHIVESALASEKFSGRDVEKSHATLGLCHEHGSKEVVLLIVEHVVAHSHSGRDKFRNATLHERLCEFRVFQLVAYSHTFASPDELRQIGVESVVRKSSHLHCCA